MLNCRHYGTKQSTGPFPRSTLGASNAKAAAVPEQNIMAVRIVGKTAELQAAGVVIASDGAIRYVSALP